MIFVLFSSVLIQPSANWCNYKACIFSQLSLVAHTDPSAWNLLLLACRNSIALLA